LLPAFIENKYQKKTIVNADQKFRKEKRYFHSKKNTNADKLMYDIRSCDRLHTVVESPIQVPSNMQGDESFMSEGNISNKSSVLKLRLNQSQNSSQMQ